MQRDVLCSIFLRLLQISSILLACFYLPSTHFLSSLQTQGKFFGAGCGGVVDDILLSTWETQ